MPSLLVSIVLPVYNCEKYITECLESIVTQTYKNWELIIVDDGSTDRSAIVIDWYIIKKINNINFVKIPHRGFTNCLNFAISLAKGKYIARMDADDIMLPTRLEKQVIFLKQHPHIGILGTNAYEINENGEIFSILKKPEGDFNIKKAFSYDCPILHPSVMMHKSLFDNNSYDECNLVPEDYELWIRLKDVTMFENLQEPLIKKRKHLSQMTYFKNKKYIYYGVKFSFLYNIKNKHFLYAILSVRPLLLYLLPSWLVLWVKNYKYKRQMINLRNTI